MFIRLFFLSALTTCLCCAPAQAQALKAPAGLFKNLNDKTVGDAMIVNGKQLFIDERFIERSRDVRQRMNPPVQHPEPVLVPTVPGSPTASAPTTRSSSSVRP